MQHEARNAYLTTQVMTAPPQKLRLVLVEAAIRAANQTLEHRRSGKDDEALESLIRCRSMVAELLSGVKPDGSRLTNGVVSVYSFLFLLLTEAQQERDSRKLHDAIRILEVERETWRRVCDAVPAAPAA